MELIHCTEIKRSLLVSSLTVFSSFTNVSLAFDRSPIRSMKIYKYCPVAFRADPFAVNLLAYVLKIRLGSEMSTHWQERAIQTEVYRSQCQPLESAFDRLFLRYASLFERPFKLKRQVFRLFRAL